MFNDQDNEFDKNRLIKLDIVTFNRNPGSDIELANKNYIDDEIDKKNKLRFKQTLENYLKVSAGNDVYNFTNYDKIQITDTTIIKFPNTGANLLQIGIYLLVINLMTVNFTNIHDQQKQTVQA